MGKMKNHNVRLADKLRAVASTGQLKFPYALVLDDKGNPTGQAILPQQYDAVFHKGKIGCPCCASPLEVVKLKETCKKPEQSYFRSKSLQDHSDRNCVVAGIEDARRSEPVMGLLELISKPGPKIIYLDIPINEKEAISYPYSLYATNTLHRPFSTARKKGDLNTGSIRSMREFAQILGNIDADSHLFDDIDFMSQNYRIPARELIAGNRYNALSDILDYRDGQGLNYPAFVSFQRNKSYFHYNDESSTWTFGSVIRATRDFSSDSHMCQIFIETQNTRIANMLKKKDHFGVFGMIDDSLNGGILREFETIDGVRTLRIRVNDERSIAVMDQEFSAKMPKVSYDNPDVDYSCSL